MGQIQWFIISYFLVVFIALILNKTMSKNRKSSTFEGEHVGLDLTESTAVTRLTECRHRSLNTQSWRRWIDFFQCLPS